MARQVSRREFVRGAGAAVLALSFLEVRCGGGPAGSGKAGRGERAVRPRGGGGRTAVGRGYRGWEDLYRERWRWDRVAKGTHLRANCASGCSWDLYVKEGIVWREEQADVYHETVPGVPEFGPRGCQKGACYSALMYSPARLKYPLERVGPRGGGHWRRLSWEEALTRVADRLIDVLVEDGPGPVAYDFGNIDFGPSSAGELLFFSLLGIPTLDGLAGGGDLPLGAVQTWGLVNVDGSADDWFNADLIVVWSMNPVYTRIPEAHFLWEARYHGSRVVVVAPDYSATAVHADLWLNPRMETDAALALGLAHVIVAENLYQEGYVREQTDLPLLVRTDTGRFLREADLVAGGKDDVFYFWDEVREAPAEAPGSMGHRVQSLALGGGVLRGREHRPALAGRYRVRLAGGREQDVRPVFELLREHLAAYSPEAVAVTTGVGAETIRRLARELARARAALILASFGSCKHYHSDLMQRAMILLAALTGNQGRRGGGLRFSALWSLAGFEGLASGYEMPWWQRLALRFMRPSVRTIEWHMRKAVWEEHAFQPLLLWLWKYGGMDAIAGRREWVDPALPRDPAAYVKEAMDRHWFPLYPGPGKKPRIYFATCSNPLRTRPAPQVMERALWSKLELTVNVNFRMSTTALKSDLVLPAASYYEKRGIKYGQSYLPYIVLGDRAVEPLGESLGEWELYGRLAETVQRRARARGVGPYRDVFGKTRDLSTLYDRWSREGRFPWQDDRPALDYILARSEPTRGLGWEEGVGRGAARIRGMGMYGPGNAVCSDFEANETVYPSGWFVSGKEPWPTLTGRQQFYLDHPWFLEAGEALPCHKEPPGAATGFRLRLNGGHTRWSIHAIWRDEAHMLRLQRGEPAVFASPADARRRGLRDGDRVRVYNDVGSFVAVLKVAAGVQPGEVIAYHAWEPYQFPGWRGSQEVVASALKPLHLVGDYGHLTYRMYYSCSGYTPRGTPVEIERA